MTKDVVFYARRLLQKVFWETELNNSVIGADVYIYICLYHGISIYLSFCIYIYTPVCIYTHTSVIVCTVHATPPEFMLSDFAIP